MSEAVKILPENIDDLKALLIAKDKLVCEKDQRIAVLEEQLQLLIHKRFGASSEKAPTDQLNLFNEAEAAYEASAEMPAAEEAETTVPEHKRKKPGRKPLPEDLRPCEAWLRHDALSLSTIFPTRIKSAPVAVVSETRGARCRPCIGKETSEQLDIKPPQIQVLQHVRYKYGACPDCDGAEDAGPAVIIARMPPQPIPKSILFARFQQGAITGVIGLYRHCQISGRPATLPAQQNLCPNRL